MSTGWKRVQVAEAWFVMAAILCAAPAPSGRGRPVRSVEIPPNRVDVLESEHAITWETFSNPYRLTLPVQHDIAPVQAFVPGAPPELRALVWRDADADLVYNPKLGGKLELRVAFLAGDAFAPFRIRINGDVVGRIDAAPGRRPCIRQVTLQTPELSPVGNAMIIEPLDAGRVGLIHIDHRPLDFEAVATDVFSMEQRAETIRASTYLHRIHNGATYHFRLDGIDNEKTQLLVNGNRVQPESDGTWIADGQLRAGPNKLTVVLPGDAANRWTLRINSRHGCRFFTRNPARMPDEPPETVTISSDRVSATLPLPDPERGYYRGPRFEQAGMITELRYDGHNFVADFVLNDNPLAPSRAAGTASEFSTPVGYDEAEPGGTFLKIGVGLLNKPFEQVYAFGNQYLIKRRLPYTYTLARHAVEFNQRLEDFNGWGYKYTKRLELLENEPTLIIENTLRNTGRRRIRSIQYCHNFFAFDGERIDKHVSVQFGFPVQTGFDRVTSGARREGDRLVLTGSVMFKQLTGGFSADRNAFRIEHLGKNIGIRYSTDFAPCRCCLYADAQCVSPESFVWLDLASGESRTWRRRLTLLSGKMGESASGE